jgi:hypothetical protein
MGGMSQPRKGIIPGLTHKGFKEFEASALFLVMA